MLKWPREKSHKIERITVNISIKYIIKTTIIHLGKNMTKQKGATEDEMVGWHHWLNGHEFELTPGDSEGQGSLAWSSWCHKESDMT